MPRRKPWAAHQEERVLAFLGGLNDSSRRAREAGPRSCRFAAAPARQNKLRSPTHAPPAARQCPLAAVLGARAAAIVTAASAAAHVAGLSGNRPAGQSGIRPLSV